MLFPWYGPASHLHEVQPQEGQGVCCIKHPVHSTRHDHQEPPQVAHCSIKAWRQAGASASTDQTTALAPVQFQEDDQSLEGMIHARTLFPTVGYSYALPLSWSGQVLLRRARHCASTRPVTQQVQPTPPCTARNAVQQHLAAAGPCPPGLLTRRATSLNHQYTGRLAGSGSIMRCTLLGLAKAARGGGQAYTSDNVATRQHVCLRIAWLVRPQHSAATHWLRITRHVSAVVLCYGCRCLCLTPASSPADPAGAYL